MRLRETNREFESADIWVFALFESLKRISRVSHSLALISEPIQTYPKRFESESKELER